MPGLRSVSLGVALCLSACVGSDVGLSSAGDDSDTGSTGDMTQGSTTGTTTTTTTDPTESTTGATGSGGSTTGPIECGGLGTTGNSTGADGPWLEVTHDQEMVMDGSVLNLSCGGQGFTMFELFLFFGGFETHDIFAPLSVVLDVPGYNTGPVGPFYSYVSDYYLGCDQTDPYHSFPLFAPDDISDVNVLNGVPGTLTVELETPLGAVGIEADVTLAVDPMTDWNDCGF